LAPGSAQSDGLRFALGCDKREVFAPCAFGNGAALILDGEQMDLPPPVESLSRRIARLLAVGFVGKGMSSELQTLIDRGVSGVILFSRNIESPEQVAELCAAIKRYAGRPIYVAVDQEGGVVQRLRDGFTRLPTMRELGSTGRPELAFAAGAVLGRELRAVGIDVNFAPVIDVDTNPNNPVIGNRAFSANPLLVARMGVALGQGMESEGVASCGKHFPGHGDTELDSHLALPTLRHGLKRLREVELVPFRQWSQAKLASIMTAHVIFEALDPKYPATMSAAVMSGLLRDELKFEGLAISDDLEMKAVFDHFGAEQAAIVGLEAGVDQFLVCHRAEVAHTVLDALQRGVNEGIISGSRLLQAEGRALEFLRRWARPAADFDKAALRSVASQAVVAAIQQSADHAESGAEFDPTERSNG
jgi:beta-N-acetylhexosaminidase